MQTKYPGIVKDHLDSEPRIEGTRFTVSRIINDLSDCLKDEKKLEKGIEKWLSLFIGYPTGYITKEKILQAIDYYRDNKKEINGYIQESRKMSGQIIRTGPAF